jgi:hypothetical protein
MLIDDFLASAVASAGSDEDGAASARAAAASLRRELDCAAAVKIAALEAEAVALEAVLDSGIDLLVCARAVASDPLSSKEDKLVAATSLRGVLPALCTMVSAELVALFVVPQVGAPPLHCRLVAPAALSAADIRLVSQSPQAICGAAFTMFLVAAAPAVWNAAEWDVAIPHLAASVAAFASLELHWPDGRLGKTRLAARISADPGAHRVGVTVMLPAISAGQAGMAPVVELAFCIVLHGETIRSDRHRVPVILRAALSQATLLPRGHLPVYPQPAVSADGRIFVPTQGGVQV